MNASKSANCDGGLGNTSACSPACRIDLAPVGNANLIPSVNCHVLSGLFVSNNETVPPVMFNSSMYSTSPSTGLYMISLITTGPTFGAALALPLVGTLWAVKSVVPSLLRIRPNVTSRSAAPKLPCSR